MLYHSEKSKKLISQGNKKPKHSSETIAKFCITRTGIGNAMFGRKHTEETKLKMRLRKLGKIVSIETKQKMRESHLKRRTQ